MQRDCCIWPRYTFTSSASRPGSLTLMGSPSHFLATLWWRMISHRSPSLKASLLPEHEAC